MSKIIKREDIAREVSRRLPVSKRDALAILNSITDVMFEAQANGDTIVLRGFGTFMLKPFAGCLGRDPRSKNGDDALFEIPPHMRISFTPSEELRKRARRIPVSKEWKPRVR